MKVDAATLKLKSAVSGHRDLARQPSENLRDSVSLSVRVRRESKCRTKLQSDVLGSVAAPTGCAQPYQRQSAPGTAAVSPGTFAERLSYGDHPERDTMLDENHDNQFTGQSETKPAIADGGRTTRPPLKHFGSATVVTYATVPEDAASEDIPITNHKDVAVTIYEGWVVVKELGERTMYPRERVKGVFTQ